MTGSQTPPSLSTPEQLLPTRPPAVNLREAIANSPSAAQHLRLLKQPRRYIDVPQEEDENEWNRFANQEVVKPKFEEVMEKVKIYIEYRKGADNRTEGIKKYIRNEGVVVMDRLNMRTTHVIFNEGSLGTYRKAKAIGLPIVNLTWYDRCRKELRVLSPDQFRPEGLEKYENPELYRLRREKSMQPDIGTVERPLPKIRLKVRVGTPKIQVNDEEAPMELDDGDFRTPKSSKRKTICTPKSIDVASSIKASAKVNGKGLKVAKRSQRTILFDENMDETGARDKEDTPDQTPITPKVQPIPVHQVLSSTQLSEAIAPFNATVFEIDHPIATQPSPKPRKLFNPLRHLDDDFNPSPPSATKTPKRKTPKGRPLPPPVKLRQQFPLFTVRPKRRHFAFSGFHRDARRNLQSLVAGVSNDDYMIDDKVTDKTTHLIIATPPGVTVKALFALIYGVWLLDKRFVEESHAHGAWQSEEKYELNDFASAVGNIGPQQQACRSGGYHMELFSRDDTFYIAKDATRVAAKYLVRLIRVLGGRVVTKAALPKYVLADQTTAKIRPAKNVLQSSWLIDSIKCNRVKATKKYLLTES